MSSSSTSSTVAWRVRAAWFGRALLQDLELGVLAETFLRPRSLVKEKHSGHLTSSESRGDERAASDEFCVDRMLVMQQL